MADAEQHIEGELLRFRFQSPDGAFAVAYLRPEGGSELTLVGPIGHVTAGQHVRVTGRWEKHSAHGRQFRVQSVLVEDPRTERGIERYLASDAVKGLGKTFAKRVVDHFGTETLRIIAEEPHRLLEVEGIGRKRMEQLEEQWAADRVNREVMAALRSYGLGAALANRILKQWGAEAAAVVAREPYRLITEIQGVGFRTADAIARSNGVTRDDPTRAEAALVHLVRQAEGQGHCFLPQAELLRRSAELELPRDQADPALDRLALEGRLFVGPAADVDHRPVYPPALAQAEAFVARRLGELAGDTATGARHKALLAHVDAAQSGLGLALAPGQRSAVELALAQGVCVITGGPGTGKTTIVRVLVGAATRAGQEWLLAAPTGRAAKRLAEATGREAKTIHRLLEFNGHTGQFTRDFDQPLDVDGVLIDEASMVDLRLMQSLLRALPDGCQLVLVGDADQLPSVGAGRVLGDVIASGELPVATLREVYRQAADSGIVRNAWRINQGEVPRSSEREEDSARKDFFVVHRREVQDARQTLLEVVSARLRRLGFDPLGDVQVLTPMHAGPLGTQALNTDLQALLNPSGAEHRRGDKLLRVGDRVIQVRNNYDLDIFNGDVGRVTEATSSGVVVDFADSSSTSSSRQEVAVTGEQLNDLELAYAISIHKSQGSEYPAVVVVLHRAHRIMLRRNLLYTAVTRAQRFCCIVGDPWAIETACEQRGGDERWTRLADRLRDRAEGR